MPPTNGTHGTYGTLEDPRHRPHPRRKTNETSEIIIKAGDYRVVAEELDKSQLSVLGWIWRNRIPDAYWKYFMKKGATHEQLLRLKIRAQVQHAQDRRERLRKAERIEMVEKALKAKGRSKRG